MSHYIQANTDGKLHDATQPSVSPLSRAFLYGDSIYEVFRTYDGLLFAFNEHWERLNHSSIALGLPIPFDRSVLLTEIRRTVSAYFEKEGSKTDLYVRLQISRGAGRIGLDPGFADKPSYVLLVQALPPYPPEKMEKGLVLSIARTLYRNHPQTLNPAWKTGNYLNNLLCLKEAKARRADDVLITNLDGAVAEASSSNVFFVTGKEVVTPPVSDSILEGVTRKIILREVALSWKYEICEETIYPAQLGDFDECFVTSTTRDIVPVERIDGVEYLVGKKTVTSQLKQLFQAYVDKCKERQIELKLF